MRVGSAWPRSTRSYPAPLFVLPHTTPPGNTSRNVAISLFTAAVLLWYNCTKSVAFIALADAFTVLKKRGLIKKRPLTDYLAAISVGKVGGEILVDLAYTEDSMADVDMNVVMTGQGRYVEVQGTAERTPFDKQEMDEFMAMGWSGIQTLTALQKDLIGELE